MANTPQDLRYTKDHGWVRVKGDRATIGITDRVQNKLGIVAYVELPKVGERFEASEPFGSVEGVEDESDIYMPVTGSIVEVNEVLTDSPELVNEDPYGDGWMIVVAMEDASQVDDLLNATKYEDYIKEEV